MPNIEIHGTSPAVAQEIRSKIEDMIVGDQFVAHETVVTTVADHTIDLRGQSRPFLRIYDTGVLNHIILRLRTLGMDIEIVHLQKFIPGG